MVVGAIHVMILLKAKDKSRFRDGVALRRRGDAAAHAGQDAVQPIQDMLLDYHLRLYRNGMLGRKRGRGGRADRGSRKGVSHILCDSHVW